MLSAPSWLMCLGVRFGFFFPSCFNHPNFKTPFVLGFDPRITPYSQLPLKVLGLGKGPSLDEGGYARDRAASALIEVRDFCTCKDAPNLIKHERRAHCFWVLRGLCSVCSSGSESWARSSTLRSSWPTTHGWMCFKGACFCVLTAITTNSTRHLHQQCDRESKTEGWGVGGVCVCVCVCVSIKLLTQRRGKVFS